MSDTPEQNEAVKVETTPGAEAAAAAPGEAVVRKKKGKKSVPNGIVYILSTFNNTLISITDPNGNVVSWSSAGSKGFRGSRKNTPFAAQVAAEDAVKKALEHGMRTAAIEVRGPGAGRESAMRAVYSAGLRVTQLKDTTPIPHNGCRPPKRRRV
jgi:small subunit ribosomal protein S11